MELGGEDAKLSECLTRVMEGLKGTRDTEKLQKGAKGYLDLISTPPSANKADAASRLVAASASVRFPQIASNPRIPVSGPSRTSSLSLALPLRCSTTPSSRTLPGLGVLHRSITSATGGASALHDLLAFCPRCADLQAVWDRQLTMQGNTIVMQLMQLMAAMLSRSCEGLSQVGTHTLSTG